MEEINSEKFLINDICTRNLTRGNIHDLFCMVLQYMWLFKGKIREDLIYNPKYVSDEVIKKARKAVGLDHFIKTLNDGYDTILNDKVNLSVGKKQQLIIARAMSKDAPMLILDEATSSLDIRTELLIQNAIDKLIECRTSLVISHRLQTIKNSYAILILNGGDILERGNHDDLISKDSFYAELYSRQFK